MAEGVQLSALPLLLQVGRVAANLAIDNGESTGQNKLMTDVNRRALIDQGYPQTALTVLATQLPLRSDQAALNAAKSLIASLLNLSYLEDCACMSDRADDSHAAADRWILSGY